MSKYISHDQDLSGKSLDQAREMFDHLENIDELDSAGSTLLLSACTNKQIELVQYFISCGANLNFLDNVGDTPLLTVIDTCSQNEELSLRIAELLLDNGADIELRGYMDKTPFLKACCRNSLKMVKFLINRGCDINAKVEEYGDTYDALYFARLFDVSSEIHEYLKNILRPQ